MSLPLTRLRSVLCLGAHPDDIEIGCGGTLLELRAAVPDVELTWVVFSGNAERRREAETSFADWTGGTNSQLRMLEFDDTLFPWQGREIKRALHEFSATTQPDLVLTHRRDDDHQDHRALAEFTWQTFRRHLIWEYEIPKYEGDLGHPNLFVPLREEIVARKIELLLMHFPTQRCKPWFDAETFRGLLRLRGIEACGECRYAEAFHTRKLTLTFDRGSPGLGS